MKKNIRKVRWGIISAANITSRVIPAIKNSRNSILTAIASRSRKKAVDLSKKFNIKNVFDSYEKILDPELLDAVYIPLINNLHFEWSYKALKNGINVLCEKPFTLDPKEAKILIDYAQKRDLYIREGFMYRFHPQYDLIMKVIKKKGIGEIKSIYSVFTYYNDDSESYILQKKYGGGSLMDVGCYCVHLSRMVTGKEPIKVFAVSNDRDVDISMIGIMEFENEIHSTFESSISEHERHLAIIRGERGEIELNNPWSILGESKVIIKTERNQKTIILPYYDTYRIQIEDFSDLILGKKGEMIDPYDPYYNMKVIDALKRSSKKNKSVYLR